MPGTGVIYEYSDHFGALDSDAAEVAEAGNSHVLREMGRNANRLGATGYTLLHTIFNASNDGAEQSGAMGDYATFPEWQRVIGPIVVPHKPNLRTAEIKIVANITLDKTIYFQIATGARPRNTAPRLDGSADNILIAVGTGDFETYSLTGIPLGEDVLEPIEILTTSGGMEDASGLGTNPVTITICGSNWFWAEGATVTTTFQNFPTKVVGVFSDVSSGQELIRRQMTGAYQSVIGADSGGYYHFRPEIEVPAQQAMRGKQVDFYISPTYRIASIVLVEEDGF